MTKRILLITAFFIVGTCMPAVAERVYYTYDPLHLKFVLDTETKEAMLGNGIDQNYQSSLDLFDDNLQEWPDLDFSNLVIPSTITCEGWGKIVGSLNPIQIESATYTVTSIADYALYACLKTKTITLPETIKEIGDYAFYSNINLESINIPEPVTAIKGGTFYNCKKLKSIHLPNNIQYIGYSAFSDCIALEGINIPSSCLSIEDEAFKWCTSLSTLTIEDGTTPLKIACCYGLGINYEGDMPRRYRGMFSDCPLKRLYLGRDIEFFSQYVNGWYPPFMGYYYKGKGTDGKDIFLDVGKIYEEVTIGDNVTVIPNSMFQYATIPNAITLPSHLISIGDEAFSNSSGSGGTLHQSQLVFPATLESIGKHAFTNCSCLGIIICEGTTPPSLPDKIYYHAFSYCNPLFIVPTGCRETYLSAENWDKQRVIEISDEVVTINVKTAGTLLDRVLAQGYQLGSITRLKLKGTLNDEDWTNIKKMTVLYDLDISEIDLETIAPNQFEKSSLVYLKLPNTLKTISDYAFYQSRSLSGILEIPASCTEIGQYAFKETAISGLSYEGAIHIKGYAFQQCLNLENLYIKGEGTIVDQYAFSDCGLKKLTIGKGVTLGDCTTFECKGLKEVVIEDGVKNLKQNSLYINYAEKIYVKGSILEDEGGICVSNDYLKEVHISDIGKWCQLTYHPLTKDATLFCNGEELVNIEIPENVKKIGRSAFLWCDKLKTVKFLGNTEVIGEYAFSHCNQLESIQFPQSLKEIKTYAFQYCESLASIDLPQSLEQIGSNAFSYCTSLNKIVTHWQDPISIDSNIFKGIDSGCWLYVPIGTASKYTNNGWDCIANIRADGIIYIKTNEGGTVNCLDASISGSDTELYFTPYKTFSISISPMEGYWLMKAKLNGEDILSQIINGQIIIEEPEDDQKLELVFAENGVFLGDANGDKVTNEEDAHIVAKHLLKNTPENFRGYAADMNDDGQINITDIILIISKINK